MPCPANAVALVAIASPKIGAIAALALGKLTNMSDSLMFAGSDFEQQRAQRA
ncbi:hypothetical protein ART_3242 [Arthrobacter sp. PAMC 25486]|nr:hypothetical protein ART_3242 [Arthrobacter sp. PAMC 25486]